MRKLFSANHEEILHGETTDIYFKRTIQILEAKGLENTEVVAEIFPTHEGLLCGSEEIKNLLEGKKVEVWAQKEGTPFKAKDTIVRIKGPYGEFGIFETAMLGILASSSGWATAARECKEAAGGKLVISFGARHVHPAVASVMDRAAVIGGADGASSILGAKILNLKPSGTMPHALVLIIGDTVQAAEAFDRVVEPEVPRVILVDTFHDEAEESLRVARALKEKLSGVRLDTPKERGGVTPDLVREVRARLDQAGFPFVKIFVSGGLNPEKIRILSEAGADAFGVGSYISSAKPIEMTMDLKEVKGVPLAKRGRIPGPIENPLLERIL
ncbi:MAG: nicotinate phosphoribosyltransferase [Caldiserica bacterium]|jgi:nicotinate phosphoribosyltransferase|nr:nicotinate phosphoribosyltransferase [Caldisericota bacterium]MDH7562562.1 nicotinate phosphoribosyltransferase [Caldisericota bacterium]